MKDFFIKIRHFKEASSKSSENPQWVFVCIVLVWKLAGGQGFREGPGQRAPGFHYPHLMTQNLSRGWGALSPMGCSPAFYPVAHTTIAVCNSSC